MCKFMKSIKSIKNILSKAKTLDMKGTTLYVKILQFIRFLIANKG